jgi:UDP:flavonoid glycosyltransferase YjiC (YdhE family)
MAIVFLAHNGIGVGHLARALRICDALSAFGEAPVIFAQTPILGFGKERPYPGKTIPNIRKSNPHDRVAIVREIERYVGLSNPGVVVEDTHPSGLVLDSSIRRILVVRPTVFDYMQWLHDYASDVYYACLIADCPQSPTWIYNEEQTSTILDWSNWHILGPVYRLPTNEQIEGVARKYGVSPGDPICTMSMGGGGIRSTADDDIQNFLNVAEDVAVALKRADPMTRSLFVRGPLFPSNIRLPDLFEPIVGEAHVPALLRVSRAAIIRPGYNTTWECISAGTPFMPVFGTSYQEPMIERISRLEEMGYATFRLPELWNSNNWIARQDPRAKQVRDRWPSLPEPTVIMRQLSPVARQQVSKESSICRYTSRQIRGNLPLAIRIDDVVALDGNTRWLLELLAGHGLSASLETIPYLCRFTEDDLTALDPSGLFTVGQHGYAHIPRTLNGMRGEFGIGLLPDEVEIGDITDGYATLRRRFPNRFKGGFSPPFDTLPEWLGPLWKELGGQFISCIWAEPRHPQVPVVRIPIEVWSWKEDVPVPIITIVESFRTWIRRRKYAGIVIHPWLLTRKGERQRIEEIVWALITSGAQSVPLSEFASLENRSPAATASRF